MVNAKKAKAQRKAAAPKPPGLVSRLTLGELAYFRKVGTEAEAALGALNQARADVQQAQVRLEAAASAFTAKHGALSSYGNHVLEVRKLDPAAHAIRDDGGITRRPAAPDADGIKEGDQIEVSDADTKAA